MFQIRNVDPLKIRRAEIEARIEQLIELLDLLDGDPDLEDSADHEAEETDEDGDEQDTLQSEDDNSGGGWFLMGKLSGGSGV